MPITVLLTPKGGSGKTTIASNLGACLHRRGAKVLLVDADPQGTLTDWRGAAGEDADLPSVVGMEATALSRELPGIAEGYDHAIIDAAGQLGAQTGAAIRTADAALIPVRASAGDLWAVAELIDLLKGRQEATGGAPKAAFVVSQAVTGANLSEQITEALSGFELPAFGARTGHRVAYAQALSTGGAVIDRPRSKAAAEIEALTDELNQLLQSR